VFATLHTIVAYDAMNRAQFIAMIVALKEVIRICAMLHSIPKRDPLRTRSAQATYSCPPNATARHTATATTGRVNVGSTRLVSRLRERDSKWLVWNPLLHQVNRRPDFVLRYEGFGEKAILWTISRASKAVRQILRDETRAKIRGVFAVFPAFGTASLFMVAERVGFEPTVRFPAHTLSKRAP
jgi:hypothetical protein